MTAPTTPSPERQPADAGGGLLPCPMCDGPGHLQHTVQQLDDGWHVICHGKKDCPLFCSTPYRLHDTKAEARAAWNRRSPAPQAQPDAREVEGLYDEQQIPDPIIRSAANLTVMLRRGGLESEVINSLLGRIQALSAPAADDGWRPSREEVARAINPVLANAVFDGPYAPRSAMGLALEAADRVLALHPAAPTEEVGKS